MAFRSKEMMKKILKKVGEYNVAQGVKKALKKSLLDNKVIMGRAKRGLFGGHRIQFGNQVNDNYIGRKNFIDTHECMNATKQYKA